MGPAKGQGMACLQQGRPRRRWKVGEGCWLLGLRTEPGIYNQRSQRVSPKHSPQEPCVSDSFRNGDRGMQGEDGEAGGRETVWVGSEEACGAGSGQRLGSHWGRSHSAKEVGHRRGRRSPRVLP